jgi:hypothetical protein
MSRFTRTAEAGEVSASSAEQYPHSPHARPTENLLAVRGVGQLSGQIKTGEVKLFVEAGAPLRTVRDVVDHTGVGQVYSLAALAIVTLQLARREGPLFQRAVPETLRVRKPLGSALLRA